MATDRSRVGSLDDQLGPGNVGVFMCDFETDGLGGNRCTRGGEPGRVTAQIDAQRISGNGFRVNPLIGNIEGSLKHGVEWFFARR